MTLIQQYMSDGTEHRLTTHRHRFIGYGNFYATINIRRNGEHGYLITPSQGRIELSYIEDTPRGEKC